MIGREMATLASGRRVRLGWAAIDDVTDDALLPDERDLLAPSALRKRRQEFAAGRAAARRAAAGSARPDELAVLPIPEGPEAGRPSFVRRPDLVLSISHAGGVAVAGVAAAAEVCALGVDLECVTDLSAAFLDEAFAPSELRGYAWLPEGVRPQWAWAVKEAVLKVWGVGLRAPLQRVCLIPGAIEVSEGEQRFALRAETEADVLPRAPKLLEVCVQTCAAGVLAVAAAAPDAMKSEWLICARAASSTPDASALAS